MAKEAKAQKQGGAVAPQRQGPLSAVPRFGAEFERFFDDRWPWLQDFFTDHRGLTAGVPRVDVADLDDKLQIRVELPGFSKDDIKLSLDENTLTVRAEQESRSESEEDGKEYYRREITHRSMARTIPLPAKVTGDQADATFKDGMLEVIVPKASDSRRQRIEIKG